MRLKVTDAADTVLEHLKSVDYAQFNDGNTYLVIEESYGDYVENVLARELNMEWEVVSDLLSELEACEALHFITAKDDAAFIEMIEIPDTYPKVPPEQLWLFDMEKLDKSWTPF